MDRCGGTTSYGELRAYFVWLMDLGKGRMNSFCHEKNEDRFADRRKKRFNSTLVHSNDHIYVRVYIISQWGKIPSSRKKVHFCLSMLDPEEEASGKSSTTWKTCNHDILELSPIVLCVFSSEFAVGILSRKGEKR